MLHARRLPQGSSQDHSTFVLLCTRRVERQPRGYQPQGTIREIFVLDESPDTGREPDVSMGETTKSIEKHLCAAPRWCGRRKIEDLLTIDRTESAIDMSLLRQLLFEKANAQSTQREFQRFDLSREVHLVRVDSWSWRRNLVEMPLELIPCRCLDSASKTMDWRG
jgi:hypothetical protein